jgi:PTH2 family peptidyl-tRNA hydrolase
MLIGTAILSLATGYFLGLGSSIGFIPNPFASSSPARSTSGPKSHNYDDSEESSEEEIEGVLPLDHAPNWANGEAADKRDGLRVSDKKKPEAVTEDCKLVLVVRTDLGMTKGMDMHCFRKRDAAKS